MADPSDITIRGGAHGAGKTAEAARVAEAARAAGETVVEVKPDSEALPLTPIPIDLQTWPRLGSAEREKLLRCTWGREFLGTPRHPEPSPGPWTVKGPVRTPSRYAPGGYEIERVVLDANSKCVATCDDRHQIDAYFIAASRDPAPVFLVRFHGETIGGAFATRDSAEADAAKRNGEGSTQGWRVEMYPVAP